ncbi:AAC(3) family N-acetyltransferase [Konateibacter massiliensis]|uniref:AAC(3) family N-acetyltransferase n=1 Tax=Konateibacter massiliensis TaxID=2002841 RepID=UPI000C158B85|nr:AAC(3) family N-acetyltransferase [Konateibacter massiliensis]
MQELMKEDIIKGLHRLGVEQKMDIAVHSSLSSLGYVKGGAETVIEALKEVVGKEGSIFMPALRLSRDLPLDEEDKKNGLVRKIKVLSKDEPVSAMGAIADTFRLMPDTLVGEGTFAASAWGKQAEEVKNMFRYLLENDGKAVMIGVDIYSLTAMHHAEKYLPKEIAAIMKSPKLDELYNPSQWFVEDGCAPVKAWYTIQAIAYEKGYIREGIIGNAKCMLMDIPEVVGVYQEKLIEDPYKLYGIDRG